MSSPKMICVLTEKLAQFPLCVRAASLRLWVQAA